MLADAEIPIGMADPLDIEIVLEAKRQIEIGPADQLVEDDPVINPLDAHLAAVAFVE